jgi:arylesterase / paraoxonase
VSGRSLSDAIVVIDVDDLPTDSHVVSLRVLSTPGFRGTNGDGLLNVVGFGATDDDKDGSIRLWIVNDRPSLDIAKGEFLDQARFGANATIELFRAGPNANQMKHLKTFSHEQIATPNRIAPVGGRTDAFYFTNDHGTSKVGWVSLLRA